MDIMATGMHKTFVAGGEVHAGFFFYRQSIDIRPQGNCVAGQRAAEDANHAGLCIMPGLNAAGLEIVFNGGSGAKLAIATLGKGKKGTK